MRTQDIVVGGIYRNAGAGTTTRRVLTIMDNLTTFKALDGAWCGVEYAIQTRSFAAWAGARVDGEVAE